MMSYVMNSHGPRVIPSTVPFIFVDSAGSSEAVCCGDTCQVPVCKGGAPGLHVTLDTLYILLYICIYMCKYVLVTCIHGLSLMSAVQAGGLSRRLLKNTRT